MYTLIITLAKTKPLIGVLIGTVLLIIVGLANWHGNIKATSIKWLADTIYRNGPSSEKLADGMFMVLTSILLSLGGLSLLLGLLYYL
jgi:hypothetical protein